MGKKIKRCTKKCLKHTFSLNPVHYSAVFSRELQANFCRKSGANRSITPKFNNDKRYFTVSFYLPIDKQKLSKNEQFYKNEHQKYKLDHTFQKSNIAKPKSKYSYCNVCKLDYNDYLQHIRSIDHKKRVNQNTFNLYIGQLCERINTQALITQQVLQKNQQMEDKEQKNEINLPSLSLLSQNMQINKETNLSQNPEFRKGIEPITICKSFHAFSQYHQQKSLLADQPEFVMTNPLFSPIKRYSDITEGIRLVSNIRPIILYGSQHDLNF